MRIAHRFLLAAALAVSCTGGIAGFWAEGDLGVDRSNYNSQRDRFADFAGQAVEAPAEEACAALDCLFDRLLADTVSYYIYCDWVEAAFYNIYSPTRDAGVFEYAAARMLSDDLMPDNVERLEKLRHYNGLNLAGEPCTLPELETPEGEPFALPAGEPCTILVINPSCRSCASSLSSLTGAPGRHIAICFGSPVIPDAPEWEYCRARDIRSVFDTEAAPFWFAVDAEGIVTTSYTSTYQE